MAINYRKKNWIEGQTFDPDTMNYLDGGIQQACDGVDELSGKEATTEQELLDLKYLGYTVPKEMPVQNQKTSSGYVVKVGRVDLSTLTWTAYGDISTHRFIAAKNYNIAIVDVGYAEGYSYGSWSRPNAGQNKTLGIIPSGTLSTALMICDTSCSSVADLQNALRDKFLFYQLATPYTLPLDGAEVYNDTNDLKFLGWTVPREMPIKNYVDSEGKFHKRVGRVDIGSLNYNRYLQGSIYLFDCADSRFIATENAYCSDLSITPQSYGWGDLQDKSVRFGGGRIRIRYDAYTDATAFKSAMSGVYLYYELASEVVIAEGNEVANQLPSRLVTGTFSVNTVNGDTIITSVIAGSLPPTRNSFFTVIGVWNTNVHRTSFHYDGNTLHVVSDVAQRINVNWLCII